MAARGGTIAREGLVQLGLPTPPTGMRSAGWVLYGLSMGFGAITIGFAAASNGPAAGAMALPPVSLGTVSPCLFEADSARARRALESALGNSGVGRRPRHERPAVGLSAAPVAGGGATVGIVGLW